MRQHPHLGDSSTYSFTYQIKYPLRVESPGLKTRTEHGDVPPFAGRLDTREGDKM